jgi:hypothetical protein
MVLQQDLSDVRKPMMVRKYACCLTYVKSMLGRGAVDNMVLGLTRRGSGTFAIIVAKTSKQ